MADLQARLDRLSPGREPLDLVMIDGFLCGVLLQPRPVPETRWLPLVLDVEGRPAPADFDLEGVRALLRRRRDELAEAIGDRDWFDPWVFEFEDDADPSEAVMPWVAGFAIAVDTFTELMDRHEPELTEPLAGLYRHLDPDDLEDADALLAEIETLEPAQSLDEAVEDLVRGMLLIADVVQPLSGAQAAAPDRRAPRVGARPANAPPVKPAPKGGGRAGPGPGPRSKSGRR